MGFPGFPAPRSLVFPSCPLRTVPSNAEHCQATPGTGNAKHRAHAMGSFPLLEVTPGARPRRLQALENSQEGAKLFALRAS
eukprot:7565083-Pyramimonas_sp.AAC.1